MISILMAVRTGWEFFPEAFASLYSEELVDWELIVGINGLPLCCDADLCIEPFAQAYPYRVKVLSYPGYTNKGQTLNAMRDHANGSHIAILDVDDLWHPWKLAKQVAYCRDWDVVGTMGEWFGDVEGLIDVPCGPVGFDDLLEKNCLINSSVVIRRELAQWEDTEGLDDYPLWLKLAKEGRRIMNMGGEPLVKIRCHKGQHFAGKRDNSAEIRERYRD